MVEEQTKYDVMRWKILSFARSLDYILRWANM